MLKNANVYIVDITINSITALWKINASKQHMRRES